MKVWREFRDQLDQSLVDGGVGRVVPTRQRALLRRRQEKLRKRNKLLEAKKPRIKTLLKKTCHGKNSQNQKHSNLASGVARANPNQPGKSLVADVRSRNRDIGRVVLLDQNRRQNTQENLLSVLDLGQSMIQGVQVRGGHQSRTLQTWASKRVGSPKPGEIIISDEQPRNHAGRARNFTNRTSSTTNRNRNSSETEKKTKQTGTFG